MITVAAILASLRRIFGHQPHAGAERAAEIFLMALISANVLLAALETVPSFPRAHPFFEWFFQASMLIFAAEWLLRVWATRTEPGLRGVVRVVFSPLMLLDLLAFAPFLLGINMSGAATAAFRSLRLLRIFRVFRQEMYTKAFGNIAAVLRREREEILALAIATLLVLMVASAAVFFAERGAAGTQFGTLLDAMWWGVATLTTIGYGDIVPVTATGRALGALTAAIGVGIFATLTGLLGASFYEDVARRRQEKGG